MSNAEYKVLDTLAAKIIVINQQGKISYANKAWEGFFDKNSSNQGLELVNQDFSQVFTQGKGNISDQLYRFMERIQPVISGQEKNFSCELMDNQRWYRIRVSHLDGGGAVISVKDITNHKSNKEIIADTLENLKLVLASMADMVFTLDTEQRHVGVFGGGLEEMGISPDYFIGRTSEEILGPEAASIHMKYNRQALAGETVVYTWSVQHGKETLYYQTSLSPIMQRGEEVIGIVGVARDITQQQRAILRAAEIQRQRLDTKFPLAEKGGLEIIYQAAQTISGDLFHLFRKDQNTVIGFLGDVMGKGISAALTNSALKVLFHDAASSSSNPKEILELINEKLADFTGEEYVAACCFTLDFMEKKISIASAGINKFFFKHNGVYCLEEIVRGPSLGMFEMPVLFEEKHWTFNSGDRFYFYTDGFEDFFSHPSMIKELVQIPSIKEQKTFLKSFLRRLPELPDDTTWLAIEIT